MNLNFRRIRCALRAALIGAIALAGLYSLLPAAAQDAGPAAPAGPRLFLPVIAGAASPRQASDIIPGQYIVVLKPPAMRAAAGSAATEADLANRAAAAYGGEVLYVYDSALSGFAIRLPAGAAGLLAADANVAYIEPDRVAAIPAPVAAAAAGDGGGELALAATDATTQTNAVWGLDRIDQRLLPLDTRYVYSTTAAAVHAYIIDSGIAVTHTQFTGRIGAGYTSINDGRGVKDCNGHGTHVAGTVGGTTYGVAKGVTLHPVRVFGCDGSSSNASVIAGVNWVTANHVKPAVANMSLGGSLSFALRSAVERSINAGIVYVAAAGNESMDACNSSPANVPAAITVGATTNADVRASFSNYGPCVDIFGPGDNIKSASYTGPNAVELMSGTSMAAPHVAGVVALYLKSRPTATVAEVTQWLLATATPDLVTDARPGSANRLLYSGLPEKTPAACTNKIANPGFESGVTGWNRTSTNGLQLICSGTTCGADMPAPKAGSYIAWLGRNADSETSTLTHAGTIALPAGTPARLSFWYAIDSEDNCGYDFGYVRVTAGSTTTTIKTYKLCSSNISDAWLRQQIDLSSYAGKTITLSFRATNDGENSSSLYLDDVQLVSGAGCSLLAGADAGEAALEAPENGSGEDIPPGTAEIAADTGQ